MSTPAHIAASLILAQAGQHFGFINSPADIALVVIAGNIIDLDYLWTRLHGIVGNKHHSLFTHSPLGALALVGPLLVTTGISLFSGLSLMILASLLLHLVLDDSVWLFSKLGLQKYSQQPQINWLFPFKKHRCTSWLSGEALRTYVTKAPVSLALEVILIIGGLSAFRFL